MNDRRYQRVQDVARACRCRSFTFYEAEVAEYIIPLDEMMDLAAFIQSGVALDDPASFKECVDTRVGHIRKILTAATAAGRSLKKGTGDMKSALQAHKTAESLRGHKEAADANKISKHKGGKLSKFAATSDAPVIKLHKSIEKESTIPVVKEYEELKGRDRMASRPFILRKGKNILKQLLKEESTRTEFQQLVEKFKKDFESSDKSKQQSAFGDAMAGKLRSEMMQLIPGDSTWPFVPRSLLQQSQLSKFVEHVCVCQTECASNSCHHNRIIVAGVQRMDLRMTNASRAKNSATVFSWPRKSCSTYIMALKWHA